MGTLSNGPRCPGLRRTLGCECQSRSPVSVAHSVAREERRRSKRTRRDGCLVISSQCVPRSPASGDGRASAEDGARRVTCRAPRWSARYINLDSGRMGPAATCVRVHARGVSRALAQVHVACQSGELVSFSAQGGDPVRVLTPARDLRDVVVDGDRLLVSRFKAAELLVIAADGSVVKTAVPRNGTTFFQPSVAWRMQKLPSGGVASFTSAECRSIAIGPRATTAATVVSGAIVEGPSVMRGRSLSLQPAPGRARHHVVKRLRSRPTALLRGRLMEAPGRSTVDSGGARR